ncbi:hypothetical protein [Mucilaginibacter sp. UYCu711]|uniref:hypothetical protein n=1 Tax=Mucilaginibacter sp. UYCu711 TaxID=3156339 RepID=UPI003D213FD7
MFDFDVSVLFYLMDHPGGSDLLHFFKELNRKIQLQRQHAETTTDLYRREYGIHKSALHEKREVAHVEAKKIFDEVYTASEGDEDEKWSQAIMAAEPDAIDNHFNLEGMKLDMDYKDMADHFNKSSFVIVYAVLENELRRLCGLLKTTFGKRLSLQDIESKDYLQSMINYLEKVLEIDIESCQPNLTRIRQVQFLRNKIMHAAAEFPLGDQPVLDQLIKDSKGNLYLQHFDPLTYRLLKIRKIDYVNQQYDLLLDFIYELLWCIDAKLEHALIKENLLLLFRFLDEKVEITISEVTVIKKGRKIAFAVIKGKKKILKGTLSLQAAKKESVLFINHVPENDRLKRLFKYLTEQQQTFLDDFLKPFYKINFPMNAVLTCDPH